MPRRPGKTTVLGTILIVNDEPDFSFALNEILRKDGFEVHHASSCQEARSLIKKALPDLLLVDFSLPATCGLELIHDLRNRADWKEIPIIVTSARISADDREASLNAGANIFLPKPFSRRELHATIRQYFPLPATAPLNPSHAPRPA